MVKRVRFGEPSVHLVETECPRPAHSRPYDVRPRPRPAVGTANRPQRHVTRAIERASHSNACRLHAHSSAESVLVILGKLKTHAPNVWTQTGMDASTEDAVHALCNRLGAPPPPLAMGAWSIEELARSLDVSLAAAAVEA